MTTAMRATAAALSSLAIAVLVATALAHSSWPLAPDFVHRLGLVFEYLLRALHELVGASWPIAALLLAWAFKDPLNGLASRVTEAAGWKFANLEALNNALPAPPATTEPVTVPSLESGRGGAQGAEHGQPKATASGTTYNLKADAGHFTLSGLPTTLSLKDVFDSLNGDSEDFAPELAIVALAVQIERQMRRLAAALGVYPRGRAASYQALLDSLAPNVPGTVLELGRAFYEIRNRTVHGHKVQGHVGRQAVAAGRRLFDYLVGRPEKPPVVIASYLQPYADPACTVEQTKFRVMLLRTFDGVERAVPTRGSAFKEGQELTWEWDDNVRFDGETYYRHPGTDAVGLAWSTSIEFVGRPIE